MKHLFVSYEIAVLSKDKGFDEICIDYYTKDGKLLDGGAIYSKSRRIWSERIDLPDDKFARFQSISCQVDDEKEPLTKAPLYQQLVDWLREEHNIIAFADPTVGKRFTPTVISNIQDVEKVSHMCWTDKIYTYYEALDKALQQAFELI